MKSVGHNARYSFLGFSQTPVAIGVLPLSRLVTTPTNYKKNKNTFGARPRLRPCGGVAISVRRSIYFTRLVGGPTRKNQQVPRRFGFVQKYYVLSPSDQYVVVVVRPSRTWPVLCSSHRLVTTTNSTFYFVERPNDFICFFIFIIAHPNAVNTVGRVTLRL